MEASTGSEATGAVFAGCFAARPELASLRVTPIAPLGSPLA
jgi:hypothetical protein